MSNRNHNIRFNMEKPDECRAWGLLHSDGVKTAFKSQNRFVIEAINDYYDRHIAKSNDPYLETREKEDAFADRIVGLVEGKVLSNLPALVGMYLAQIQPYQMSYQMGGYPVNTIMGQGTAIPINMAGTLQAQTSAREEIRKQGDAEGIPDNDLLDFDAF